MSAGQANNHPYLSSCSPIFIYYQLKLQWETIQSYKSPLRSGYARIEPGVDGEEFVNPHQVLACLVEADNFHE